PLRGLVPQPAGLRRQGQRPAAGLLRTDREAHAGPPRRRQPPDAPGSALHLRRMTMKPLAMKRFAARALLVAAVTIPGAGLAFGFGQNKIVYSNFQWHVYTSPHFEVHYYPEEEEFLQAIVSDAESAYAKLSKFLDHEIDYKIPLICYRTHGDFEQT